MFKQKYNQCYGISRVRRDHENAPISQLLVWKQLGSQRWTKLGWRSRQQVVKALENGVTYITLLPDTIWLRLIEGSPIHVVEMDTGKFLRTDFDHFEGDSLGDIPQQIGVRKVRSH
jgi:hypothetical protein